MHGVPDIDGERFDLVAAGAQCFVERMLTTWLTNATRETGIRKVACSGGVFMNVKANLALLELDEVEDSYIFPSCGDESNSIGAACRAAALAGDRSRPLERERREAPGVAGAHRAEPLLQHPDADDRQVLESGQPLLVQEERVTYRDGKTFWMSTTTSAGVMAAWRRRASASSRPAAPSSPARRTAPSTRNRRTCRGDPPG